MSCPNTDPSFTLLRSMLGRAATPRERAFAFWGICVPFRFLLYWWITQHAEWPLVRAAVMVAGLAAGIRLARTSISSAQEPWWWSKSFQALMGFALFVSAASRWRGYPVFLWVSLVGGIIQAWFTRFC